MKPAFSNRTDIFCGQATITSLKDFILTLQRFDTSGKRYIAHGATLELVAKSAIHDVLYHGYPERYLLDLTSLVLDGKQKVVAVLVVIDAVP